MVIGGEDTTHRGNDHIEVMVTGGLQRAREEDIYDFFFILCLDPVPPVD